MQRIRTALLNLAMHESSTRKVLLPLTRTAEKWKTLPEGWTEESVKSFWGTLTEGDSKHKVTECIKQMEGKDIDDPGAFCASLADKVLGPEWRSKSAVTKAAGVRRVANLAGTYADYVYEGDDKFLRAVAKSIRRLAGGHAERVEVVRQKGRSPFLVYEGQDGGDMNLELTFHVFPTSASQVKVGWFGTSVLRGRVSDDAVYNWGELTPDTLARIFAGLFGGGTRLATSESEAEGDEAKVEKTAFNKENAPELMSQLLAVLTKAELKDAVNQIKQKGIPDLVSKAWAKRTQG